MKKVAFYTLGCKLNFSETSAIAQLFKKKKFEKVDFYDQPDVVVINTCSVTENADKKCSKVVKEAQSNAKKIPFIIVMGCYAQLKPDSIAQIKGVDVILGTHEKFKLFDIIDQFDQKNQQTSIHVSAIKSKNYFHNAYSYDDRTRTFLKIQDGCNYQCSFCTIPLARGKSRSNTIENILKQIQKIIQKNIHEIVLTGVNTGDFGIIDGKRSTNFLTLIQKISTIRNMPRVRISSVEPNLLKDEIITIVAQNENFVPHFHIPLQSGSDPILKMMRRRYNTSLYEEKIQKIIQKMPNACIGADVMVGFPGETQEHFLATYHFINRLPIAYLHVFPYSERTDTVAEKFSNSVDKKDRISRAQQLRTLSEKKLRQFYTQNIGSKQNVLFEHNDENNFMKGFTENYIRVKAPYIKSHLNTIQSVTLQAIDQDGLMTIV